jgi:hypothetical protein
MLLIWATTIVNLLLPLIANAEPHTLVRRNVTGPDLLMCGKIAVAVNNRKKIKNDATRVA